MRQLKQGHGLYLAGLITGLAVSAQPWIAFALGIVATGLALTIWTTSKHAAQFWAARLDRRERRELESLRRMEQRAYGDIPFS